MTARFDYPDPPEADPDALRWHAALETGAFEEAFAALEEVVERLERGGLKLDDTLSCYELGVRLAERCGRIIDEAELRVTRLDQTLDRADPDLAASGDGADHAGDETG